MEKYNTLKSKKDYENFIMQIPKEKANLSLLITKPDLDFSEEEVRIVSKLFLESYNDNLLDNRLKRMLIVYIGELFIVHFGGQWNFTGLKSDSWAINEPVITKFKNEGMRMSPSEWIFGLIEKKDINHFNNNIYSIKDSIKRREDLFSKIFPKRKK